MKHRAARARKLQGPADRNKRFVQQWTKNHESENEAILYVAVGDCANEQVSSSESSSLRIVMCGFAEAIWNT